MIYEDIRRLVIEASLESQKKGLIHGTSGNISVRSDDGKVVAITPTSIPYEQLTPEMIPLVDLDGNMVDQGCKPSSELPMHLDCYRARPDIKAVVHTHSKFCTILSILDKPLPVCTIPLVFYAPDPAPIVPFELPGSAELGKAAAAALGESGCAAILEMHGLITVGPTLEKAMTVSEYVEEGAEIAYYSYLASGGADIKCIPEDKIQKLQEKVRQGKAL